MSLLEQLVPGARRIKPGTGGRKTPVSVAYRQLGKGRLALVVSISKDVGAELGFQATSKNWIEVAFDEKAGSLFVLRRPDGEGAPDQHELLQAQNREGTNVVTIPMRLTCGRHAAERVTHHVEQRRVGAEDILLLRVTLPDWAAPMRKGLQLAGAAKLAAVGRAA